MNSADTAWVVEQAKALGFDLCGVVRAEKFPEHEHTPDWLSQGYAGEMHYLSDPRRTDLQAAMPGVRGIIVCLLNYNTEYPSSTSAAISAGDGEPRGWISRYAWGDDYHDILRKKLEALTELLRARFPEPFQARSYVDTGPVQERILAKYAGLGWLGKNTLLLHPTLGSYFFLGVILTTLELQPTLDPAEMPQPDLCGNCRQCLDACPTQAFVEPYVLDARKCISYLTIELRGPIPEEHREQMGNHVFGCDICQDVCPWNQRAPMSTSQEFQPRVSLSPEESSGGANPSSANESLFLPRLERLAGLTAADFQKHFNGSAVRRTKWRGLVRNACIALGNADVKPSTPAHSRVRELLGRLANSPEGIVAEAAQWALRRLS